MTAHAGAEQWRRQIRLVVVPTFGCNLRCAHCFVEGQDSPAAMGEAQLVDLLAEIDALALDALEITGGEFFHWSGCGAALPTVARLSVPTVISTNGTLLTSEHLATLRGSSVSLCLSLDGPEAIHDALRGSGKFARLKRAAELCVRHGVPFSASVTVTRSSLPHAAATVETALELGATAIHFSPVLLLGGRSAAMAGQALDDDDSVELLSVLTALRNRVPDDFDVSWRNVGLRAVAVTHPCSVFACWGEFCLSKKYWPSHLWVLPDGEVLPQSVETHRHYSLGNALQVPLDTIIDGYWGSEQHQRFQRLCRYIYQDLIYGADHPTFSWQQLVRQASARPPEQLPAYETVTHPYDHSEEIEQARRAGKLDELEFPLRPSEVPGSSSSETDSTA